VRLAASARRLAAIALLAASPHVNAAGDADKGAKLHEACLQCHGTNVYQPPRAKVKTLSKLQTETAKWGDYYNPKFSQQEIDDLVAWLNREFYRFPAGSK